MPRDCHEYIQTHISKLNVVHAQMKDNAIKAQTSLMSRANPNANPLGLGPGDYVYVLIEPIGPAKKLRNQSSGSFIIHDVPSPHMIHLQDIATRTVQRQLIC